MLIPRAAAYKCERVEIELVHKEEEENEVKPCVCVCVLPFISQRYGIDGLFALFVTC